MSKIVLETEEIPEITGELLYHLLLALSVKAEQMGLDPATVTFDDFKITATYDASGRTVTGREET